MSKYQIVEKWGANQSASLVQETPVYFPDPEPVAPHRTKARRFSRFITLTCVWAFFIGLAINIVHHPGNGFFGAGSAAFADGDGIWFTAILVLTIYWFLAFLYCWVRLSFQIGAAAAKPCPTPQEIELELRRQGYNPSLQDVLAAHDAAKREQYENVALAAAWFAANVVIGRTARGQSPL